MTGYNLSKKKNMKAVSLIDHQSLIAAAKDGEFYLSHINLKHARYLS
jgi:hypothetical protein